MAQQEIDLLQLLIKGVTLFIKNLRAILLAFLLGASMGLIYYQFSEKVFESRMIVSSDILTFSISKALTDDFNKLTKEKNYDELAAKLKLTYKEAFSIIDINIKTPIERAELLKEEEKIALTVTVRTTDPTLFPKLQQALMDYFENNSYSQVRVKEKIRLYQGMIDKTESEINELEKLRLQFLDGKLFSNSGNNTILFDPTVINARIIELTREKLTNQNKIAIVNGTQLIDGFTLFIKPVSPKLSLSLLGGTTVGLIFVVFFIAVKSFRKLSALAESA